MELVEGFVSIIIYYVFFFGFRRFFRRCIVVEVLGFECCLRGRVFLGILFWDLWFKVGVAVRDSVFLRFFGRLVRLERLGRLE